MKYFRYLLIFVLFFVPVFQVVSQNLADDERPSLTPTFFIPKSELAPKYERLKPIVPVVRKLPAEQGGIAVEQKINAPTRRVNRYIAVDGRYIPIYEDVEETEELESEENEYEEDDEEIENEVETLIAPEQKAAPEAKEEFDFEEEEPEDFEPLLKVERAKPNKALAVRAPTFDPIDSSLPSYQNRYSQYLGHLLSFQHTKLLPYNPDLENTLNKMSSNEYVVVFRGTLQ